MDFIEELRNDDGIREKDLGNGISSFNFTSKTFKKKAWTSRSVKARGLFIDVRNKKIVARSYDKFFAIGERPETQMEALKKNLSFPVVAYVKENGYLGIVSGLSNGELFVASKSTNKGEYADHLRKMIDDRLTEENKSELAEWLYTNNYSAVFEVIDPEFDPHIVKYHYSKLVLLDIISNEIEFKPISDNDYYNVVTKFDFFDTRECEPRTFAELIENYDQLVQFLDKWNEVVGIEGFVLRDSSNFMFKVKLKWYKYWKHIRSISEQLKNKPYYEIKHYNNFMKEDLWMAVWLPAFCETYRDNNGEWPDIITIRDAYLDWDV